MPDPTIPDSTISDSTPNSSENAPSNTQQSAEKSAGQTTGKKALKNGIRLGIVAVLLAGIALAVTYRDQFTQENLQTWIDSLGSWGPIGFMLVWPLITVLFIPGSFMTLAGGFLFGPIEGSIYTSLGANVGAVLAFLIARYLARAWVEQRVGGVVSKIKKAVEDEGWRFVAFTRLVPLFPFNALNYAFGLTRVPLKTYILASWLFTLPGTIGYTYIGHATRQAATEGTNAVPQILGALAVFGVLLVLPMLIKRLRKR